MLAMAILLVIFGKNDKKKYGNKNGDNSNNNGNDNDNNSINND